LALAACAFHFGREIATTGIASGALLAAVGFAVLAFALGAAAIARIQRAGPRDLDFLGARYVRIVFSTVLIAFVIVLFGSQKEAAARMAAHLVAVAALNHLALLAPARLSTATAAIGRHRVLSAAEVLLFNVCATLVLAEGALRVYYTTTGGSFLGAQHENPFARKLVADLFGFRPNSLGYNDAEFSLQKRTGTLRVAAIGDSFFVSEVPRPQGVIARTGALLAASGIPVEVHNFGIVASDIDDYRIILEQEALAFAPDLVLLGVYVGNDLRISTVSRAFDHRFYAIDRALSDIRQRSAERRLVRDGAFRDVTRSETAEGIPITTRDRYLESVRRELAFFREDASTAVARAWFDSLAGLAQIIALCREREVPIAVVLSPSHVQVSRALLEEGARSAGINAAELDVAIPQRRLTAFLAARGVPVLDLLPAFARAAREHDPDGFYLNNDTHWSVAGNEIAAQAVARFVADAVKGMPDR